MKENAICCVLFYPAAYLYIQNAIFLYIIRTMVRIELGSFEAATLLAHVST